MSVISFEWVCDACPKQGETFEIGRPGLPRQCQRCGTMAPPEKLRAELPAADMDRRFDPVSGKVVPVVLSKPNIGDAGTPKT